MQATGLEEGGIYRHFGSKQELAGHAFDYAWKLAMDTRFEATEQIPNTVDRLKQIVRNFADLRTGVVPGGCRCGTRPSIVTTAIPSCERKLRQALSSWLDRMRSIAEEGQRRDEIRSDVDSASWATLIASTLEGSGMVGRRQRNKEPLDLACRHLGEYLETKFGRGKRAKRRPEPTSHEYSRNSLTTGL